MHLCIYRMIRNEQMIGASTMSAVGQAGCAMADYRSELWEMDYTRLSIVSMRISNILTCGQRT